MRKGKLGPLAILSLVRELRTGAGDQRPLSVAGARELVPLLARDLRAGGDTAAVVEGQLEKVACLIWIGEPDEQALRKAARADVPVIAVTEDDHVPYVLDTDIVRVPPGAGFPVEEIARKVAHRLGENATALAARLPVLRQAVVEELIRSYSRRNALIAAAVFIPGVDMPLLTLNQIRLVIRIALAYGEEVDAKLVPELGAVVGVGFGLRTVAREALGAIPVGGFAVKAAIAYAGTKAVGEGAARFFAARTASS